jgi:hypothetical protein
VKKAFEHLTTKEKLTYVLLSCLDWGSNVKWGDNIGERIQKKLKVEYDFDPKRIRSCIDLIQDTESAIREFSKYGLQKFAFKNYGDGEMYLKLYGILNAIYLQMNSIIELYEVLKLPKKKETSNKLRSLKINEIRNIVGSHTINYLDENEKMPKGFKKNFFRITQISLTPKSENLIAIDGFSNIKEFNLYQSVLEYNKVSERILFIGVFSYLKSIIKVSTKIDQITNHYEISEFEHFNYKQLYKNDKLKKKKIQKWQKEIKEELGENWKEMKVDFFKKLSEGEFEEIYIKNIDYKKNYAP